MTWGAFMVRCSRRHPPLNTASVRTHTPSWPLVHTSARQTCTVELHSFSVKLHAQTHTQTLIFSPIWWHSERIVEKLQELLLLFRSCQVSPRQSEHSIQSKLIVCVYHEIIKLYLQLLKGYFIHTRIIDNWMGGVWFFFCSVSGWS